MSNAENKTNTAVDIDNQFVNRRLEPIETGQTEPLFGTVRVHPRHRRPHGRAHEERDQRPGCRQHGGDVTLLIQPNFILSLMQVCFTLLEILQCMAEGFGQIDKKVISDML